MTSSALLDRADDPPPPSRPTKRSRSFANLANLVENHVARTWPEIARADLSNVWFTGSNVWRSLYPDLPERALSEQDWDIFTIGEPPARRLVELMGWHRTPACHTGDKWNGDPRVVNDHHVPTLGGGRSSGDRPAGYNDGYSYQTERGVVDLWISSLGCALAEIRAYPTESHAHCRAAWSFVDGLLVLPNERARGLHGGARP